MPNPASIVQHTATDTPMWITDTIYKWGMRGIWYPFFSAWCAISPFVSTRIFRRSLAMSQAEWQNQRFFIMPMFRRSLCYACCFLLLMPFSACAPADNSANAEKKSIQQKVAPAPPPEERVAVDVEPSDWDVNLVMESDGEHYLLGTGGIRLGEDGVVVRADINVDLGGTAGRIVVAKGRSYGHAAGGPWVDFTDPVGQLPGASEVLAYAPPEESFRETGTTSSSGSQYTVFQRMGGAAVLRDASVVSWQEKLRDSQGVVQHRVDATRFATSNMQITLLLFQVRTDQFEFPGFPSGGAMPASAFFRAILSHRETSLSMTGPDTRTNSLDRMARWPDAAQPPPVRASSGWFASPAFAQEGGMTCNGDVCCHGDFCIDSQNNRVTPEGEPWSHPWERQGPSLFEKIQAFECDDKCIGGLEKLLASFTTFSLYLYAIRPALAAGKLFPLLIATPAAWVATFYLTYRILKALIGGDPHLRTFDEYHYDFQAIGEFVYLKSDVLEVQARFEGEKGINTSASAVAVRSGRHVVELYFRPSKPETLEVILDGRPTPMSYEGLTLDDGTYLAQRKTSRHPVLLVVHPQGSWINVRHFSKALNIEFALTPTVADDVVGGLGGVPDGAVANDFRLRDGRPISQAPPHFGPGQTESIRGLYGDFATSWRVRPEERLFSQGQAEDFLTAEYTDLPEEITRLSDFSQAEIDTANQTCLDAGVVGESHLADCAYDVLASGDPAWADDAAASEQSLIMPTAPTPTAVLGQREFSAPDSVPAGGPMSFDWNGPNAKGDLIFISAPDLADNRYPTSGGRRHETEDGLPANLVAPAKPGQHEIRYFSKANGAVLFRQPLTVTVAEVRFGAPASLAAGEEFEVAWEGPAAAGDILFVAPPKMKDNKYYLGSDRTVKAASGSPATFIAPVEAGDYEIRYFSAANGEVLARQGIAVGESKVRIEAPSAVSAGQEVSFRWQGPNVDGDFLFIAEPSMKANSYPTGSRRQHRIRDGAEGLLVAPVEPGDYEIRYFSAANGEVLAKQDLIVQ